MRVFPTILNFQCWQDLPGSGRKGGIGEMIGEKLDCEHPNNI